jgi:signal transduction histidine kinase
MLIVVLFMGISGVMLIKKEKWKGIFYTLGYAFEIGGIAILIIKEFGWLASNFFTVNAFWISSVAEHVVFSIGISLIVKENIDEKNTLSAKLIEKQKEVINNFYKGQDRERERIARDLHDSVAGSLIAANYMLPTKISELNSDKQAIIYQKAKEILHLVIEEIRKISHDLLPPTFIEKYFYEELQLLVNRYDLALKSCKVMLIFNLNKTTRFQKELHVFRIIQELIHNSIKHSKADLIKILADDFDNQIVFTVMDNGIGFSNEEKFEGIGYQNIRGRLAAIDGGDLKVKSSNKGTIVTLTINKIAV